MTKATYTKPDQLATYVKSASHSWFGNCAVKLRSTRSSGRVADLSARVVTLKDFPRVAP